MTLQLHCLFAALKKYETDYTWKFSKDEIWETLWISSREKFKARTVKAQIGSLQRGDLCFASLKNIKL